MAVTRSDGYLQTYHTFDPAQSMYDSARLVLPISRRLIYESP